MNKATVSDLTNRSSGLTVCFQSTSVTSFVTTSSTVAQCLAHDRTLSCPLLNELMLNNEFSLLRGKYITSKSLFDHCQLPAY